LCGRALIFPGELEDFVCTSRPDEDIEQCCTIKLQRWMESGEFKGALESERLTRDGTDWTSSPWKIAIDFWMERGGFPAQDEDG
jgi:hypothetical protein